MQNRLFRNMCRMRTVVSVFMLTALLSGCWAISSQGIQTVASDEGSTSGAQTWTNVDIPGLYSPKARSYHSRSMGEWQRPSVTLNAAGVPYVAYGNGRILVATFEEGTWVSVGQPITLSGRGAEDHSLALNTAGVPHLAYTESANDGNRQIRVMKFEEGVWVSVGSPISVLTVAIGGVFPFLALDAAGVPYVAYSDSLGREPRLLSVVRFEGGAWVSMGSPTRLPGWVGFHSLALDATGVPYVAYKNFDTFKLSVMKFERDAWVPVGSLDFSSKMDYIPPSLALSAAGVPYVVYRNEANRKLSVMKFEGGSWISLSSPSPKEIAYPSLTLSAAGVPYLAYIDGIHHGRLSVMKYEKGRWVPVESPGR